jgi:hypothetical protein
VLDLSPQARSEWIRIHDEVERELGARGTFRGVRDVAAENTARLAALFHVLEHGASGTIASEEIRAAACIVDGRGWRKTDAAGRGDRSGAVGWAGVTYGNRISTPEGIATDATLATVARRER